MIPKRILDLIIGLVAIQSPLWLFYSSFGCPLGSYGYSTFSSPCQKKFWQK